MSRRLAAVVVVIGLLVGAAIVDRRHEREEGHVAVAAPGMPVSPPVAALSTAWYCPGATATPGAAADGSVIMANANEHAVNGSVTFMTNDPAIPAKTVPVELRPLSVSVIGYRQVVTAPFVAALVELDGGGVAVEQSVSGSLGADVNACASAASDRWYFADGGTTRDAVLVVTLFNPFPEDAIVDLSFATEQGRVVPQALQGVVVRARSVAAVNVGDHAVRRKGVGTSIVARRGRLAAGKIQTYDGTAGRKGLVALLGAPSPGAAWYFAEGYVAPGITQRYQIYNPNPEEAKLDLSLLLDQGAAEPFDLTVPAHGRITVLANEEARIPKGVPHGAVARSTNGVGVVVERSVDAGSPSPRAGLASTLGARRTARHWVFAAGLVTDRVDEWIMFENPGLRPATIRVTALADGQPLAIDGLQEVRLAPGRRTSIRLGDHVRRPLLPLLISADEPIVAERGVYRVKALGISLSTGIPLS